MPCFTETLESPMVGLMEPIPFGTPAIVPFVVPTVGAENGGGVFPTVRATRPGMR